jgi:hypothetical protein
VSENPAGFTIIVDGLSKGVGRKTKTSAMTWKSQKKAAIRAFEDFSIVPDPEFYCKKNCKSH